MLLTVLALHRLVAAENTISKDDLTIQALNKLLEMQRTLIKAINGTVYL